MPQAKENPCCPIPHSIACEKNIVLKSPVLGKSLAFGVAAMLMTGAFAETESAAAKVPVRIALRPNVSVHQSLVTLGEVANLSAQDLPTLQRLMGLPLGSAPRTGEAVHLERETLAHWIHLRLGIDPAAISWSGPDANDIHLLTTELSGEKIAGTAEQVLQRAFAGKNMRADISVIQVPRDITVPGGKIELKARPLSEDSLMAKHQSVWVDIWVDGSFFRTVPVGLEVSVFAPAYVLTQNLSEGQMVDPSEFVVREVEWSGRSSLPVAVANANSSGSGVDKISPALRLRHPVLAGEALTRTAVEHAPMVARGDYATLHTVQGAIELESRVEVLQDGIAGQAVRVKLPNASSAIVAKVSGPGMVEVRQ